MEVLYQRASDIARTFFLFKRLFWNNETFF